MGEENTTGKVGGFALALAPSPGEKLNERISMERDFAQTISY